MPGIQTKTFVFNNQADGLYPLVMEVIKYAQQNAKVSEAVQGKLKMILLELLTNSLKHAGQSIAILKVELMANKVVIQKTDSGNGLAIKNGKNLLQWPLPGVHHAGKIISVYNNGNASLKARLEDNCNLQFFVEETEDQRPIDIKAIPEHFGLMIITQASYAFIYRFDVDKCTNNFIVSIFTEN